MIFAAIVTTFVYSRVETVEVADISNVKVSFSLKDGLVYQTSSEPEYTVNLVVEGDKRMLSKLTAEDFRIRKDVYLKDYEKRSSVHISPADVKCTKMGGGTIKVVSVTPSDILLDLDQIISRDNVPLHALYSADELPKDYQIKVHFPAEQNTVRVTGRKRIVSSLNFVQTEKFKLSNTATNSYSFDAKLEAQPDLTYSFDTVKVFVDVSGPAPREFPSVPVQVLSKTSLLQHGYRLQLEPNDVMVRIKANTSEVYDVLPEEIHPYVDISGIKDPGKYTFSLKCWIDRNNIEVLDIRPESVTVTFVPEDVTQRPGQRSDRLKK